MSVLRSRRGRLASVPVLLAVGALAGLPAGVAAAAPPDFGTARVTGPGRAVEGDTSIREVSVGRHAGFDRVVFRSQGGLPSWRVEYVPRVFKDGSGDPVPLDGAADLQLVFQGTAWTTTPSVQPELAPRYPALRQVAGAAEFEGTLTFGLGQATRAGVRAYALTGPDRLVVDLKHPPGTPPASPAGTTPAAPSPADPTAADPTGADPTGATGAGSTGADPTGATDPAGGAGPDATAPALADPTTATSAAAATDTSDDGISATVPLAIGGGVLLLAALGAVAYRLRRP